MSIATVAPVSVWEFDEATARRLPERHRPRVRATANPEQGVVVEDLKIKSTFVSDRVLKYGASAAELRQLLVVLLAGRA
ncbi:hypothetical protein DN069_38475 [Streptacidiphilus pinicola]|uniref:Uncharacterized protein n=1 Tax=Streptacidiphilus pinicola TaxID=2219663 RepID=A0A2X0I6X8_9ACTN|nr:hypothetical protein [Streptacidiphilus pinicola]RAG80367.1 hypothetical protein DN069_38475 [Streptacidiphilus pinicola]